MHHAAAAATAAAAAAHLLGSTAALCSGLEFGDHCPRLLLPGPSLSADLCGRCCVPAEGHHAFEESLEAR
jgi:hypothetical protein